MKSRLHIHCHTQPQGRGVIVGEKGSLRALAKACENAANGALGMENVTFYSSDGHEYELIITRDVTEEEWQAMPLPYEKNSDPTRISSIQTMDSVRKELLANENSRTD